MEGRHDPLLVVLSLLVAIAASYTALSLSGRRPVESGRSSAIWLASGSATMGLGIWSMQFIGLLAFKLPVPVAYDPILTSASLLCAVAASALALQLVRSQRGGMSRMVGGAALMGIGISLMHYVGMAAIQISPAIEYEPVLFAISILVAFGASFIALWIIFDLSRSKTIPRTRLTIAGAVVMGAAISGMHYIGMAAAQFSADSQSMPGAADIPPFWLGTTIGAGVLGILGITLLGSVFDAHLRGNTERLNESLRNANAELTHLATHDVLTGLPNRALLSDRIERAIADSERDRRASAVLFIDLDRFKFVNDSVGHHVGDALLRATANRIHAKLRRADTLARLGGDEFVVLLKDIDNPQVAAELAHRIRRELETAFRIDVHELHISATIGISVYPADGTTVEELLTNADAAMYHAKQAGRDTFQFFTPEMNSFAHDRLEIENGLRRALQNSEFELHYQPKVDIGSGRVTSMEALVRWRNPERGLIGPNLFIPVAEETGLIGPLGEWVLRTACRQNKAWQDAGLRPLQIAVNLSARQFRQTKLLEFVERTLADSGLAANFLELELTESTVMSNPEESVRILEALSRMGVHIAIDDFGTGYSSLAYLKRLPLDNLKVDRSFVKDLASNVDDASIVQAVISMAHSLRLEVIAEGVETREQLELLRALGCDQFQGYYFSAAVTAEEASKFLSHAADNLLRADAGFAPSRSSQGEAPTLTLDNHGSQPAAGVVLKLVTPRTGEANETHRELGLEATAT